MKYKTLFRLMLKAIGVFCIAIQGPQFIYFFQRGGSFAVGETLMQFLHPMVAIAIGLYLFFGGRWIVDTAIPSNRPYCHECGYDLTGAVGNVCNECGTAFRSEAA